MYVHMYLHIYVYIVPLTVHVAVGPKAVGK